MGQRVHKAKYWRSHADETLAIADQMPDPECKRLLIRIADSYVQLARHARAAEEANGTKIGGLRKF